LLAARLPQFARPGRTLRQIDRALFAYDKQSAAGGGVL
jgi:hypothetical protein